MSKKEDREEYKPPLCVWCSAPWTDDMLRAYAEADVSWGEYGQVDGITIHIDVTCSTCKRLVYRKEIEQSGNRHRF